MKPQLLLDGWDVEHTGLVLDSKGTGWRDAPEYRHTVASLPGRRRSTILNPNPAPEPRRLVVSGTQRASSMAELRAAADLLKRRFQAAPPLRIAFGDSGGADDRVHFAQLEKLEISPVAPAFAQPVQQVKVQLLCVDPRSHDLVETVVDFTDDRTEMPLGTEPSYPTVTITGPVVDPVLVYRDADGVERLRMEFKVQLGLGGALVLDCDALVIRDGAGVPWPESLKAAPDFVTLDPLDAADVEGPWPTLEITPKPGSATARYRRSWS